MENLKFAVEMWLANRLGSDVCVDDYDLISWIGNLFGGKAGKWWSRLGILRKDQAPEHRRDLESFWVELRHVFGERKLPFTDELDLFNLRQDKLTIAEFNSQFRQLASCVDWSREKLEAALYLSKLNSYFVGQSKISPPIPTNVIKMMEKTELADPQFMPILAQSSGGAESSRRVVQMGSVRKLKPRCQNCDKVGHIKPNCPLLMN